MLVRRIPETPVPGKPLGRHVCHDERSRGFPAPAAGHIVSANHEAQGLPFDQGNIGSCTANALCGALNSHPNALKLARGPWTEKGAVRLYRRETANEGEPYPPNDPGGSGLAVCQAAVQMGMITSYTHAFSVQDALLALVNYPVITGVNWYDSFDRPDSSGLVAISPGAQVRGGHEIVADGIDADRKLVWLWNSWGLLYGEGGRFCWSFDTWARLLAEQGDATVPVK